MAQSDTRPAGKAEDGWYRKNPTGLRAELEEYLGRVPDSIDGKGLPIPGARVIIAPHAGYTYSGPCAAWAYKCLDLSKAKRVFVLGPSHTYYLQGCALTKFSKYATPFGELQVDTATTAKLRSNSAPEFLDIVPRYDKAEHSLEMHLPYLYKRLQQTFSSPSDYPPIVPILVGSINAAREKAFGKVLAEYVKDPDNAFIISSDFCHWGSRFGYSVHVPGGNLKNLEVLDYGSEPTDPPLHESIKILDYEAIDAIESGKHDAFVGNLEHTENTVCGRHPIGVMMAALEELQQQSSETEKYRFKFVQYDRSNLATRASDSSVSYASAYAIA